MIPMIRVANSKSTRCEISNAIFEKSIGGAFWCKTEAYRFKIVSFRVIMGSSKGQE